MEEKTYTIELTESHLHVISAALMNGPYGAVAPVVAHINAQIQEQRESTQKK